VDLEEGTGLAQAGRPDAADAQERVDAGEGTPPLPVGDNFRGEPRRQAWNHRQILWTGGVEVDGQAQEVPFAA
jgi:hypothetical protein